MNHDQVKSAFADLSMLEATRSRTEKADILRTGNKTLKRIFKLSYDFRLTYGLCVPDAITQADSYVRPEKWSKFKELLFDFAGRNLTGNAAIKAWNYLYKGCNDSEQKWFSRILNRDLRVGVGTKTIQAVWPNLIDVFSCQLAQKFNGPGDIEHGDSWIVEPKFDGFRVLNVLYGDGRCAAFTRGGHELPNLEPYLGKLLSITQRVYPDGVVIDSEAVVQGSWNNTAMIRTLPQHLSEEDHQMLDQHLILHAIDIIPLESFTAGRCDIPLEERKRHLRAVVRDSGSKYFKPVKHLIAKSEDDIFDAYKAALDADYEGIVIKDPKAGYENKRTKNWLKYKPTVVRSGFVVKCVEGEGKHRGSLGSIEIQLDDGNKIRVGGGYTDGQRQDLWKRRTKLKGLELEFRDQHDTSKTVSRFPVFIRLREDK